MSIIYDALKKVERSNTAKVDTDITNIAKGPEIKDAKIMPPPSSSKPRRYIIWGIVILGLFIAGSFFVFKKIDSVSSVDLSKQSSLQPNETAMTQESPAQEKKLDVRLVLNGVFFSEDKGYALINNQILSEGDVIEGKVVKHITLTDVELEDENYKIKLSNRAK